MKAIPKISCIYTITNLINGKMYVGYTKDFFKRKGEHEGLFRNNSHDNQHLQNVYNKNGKQSLVIEVLEECPILYLAALEHYWATVLNVHNREYGYNIKLTHPEDKPKTHSEETRKKISKAHIGIKRGPLSAESLKSRQEKRKNVQFSEQAKQNIKKLAKERPVNWKTIEAMRASRKGKKCPPRKKRGKPSKEHIINMRLSKKALRVIQLDLENNYMTEWISAMDVKRNLGYDNSTINKCCKNIYHKDNKSYGFRWIYKENYLKL